MSLVESAGTGLIGRPAQTRAERSTPLLEAKLGGFNERFRNFFAWYAARMIRRSFNAVRLAPGSAEAATEADRATGPLLMVMNHASWWDPLTALVIGAKLLPHRRGIAPMDAEQLRKFAFFRRLGIFGIDPDDPASMDRLVDYVASYTKSGVHARPSIVITPQGHFTDVREPVLLKPGAAAIVARLQRAGGLTPPGALVMNLEYSFWLEQHPELFVRLEFIRPGQIEGESEARSIVRLNRELTGAMQSGGERLAELVRARDPRPFSILLRRSGSTINPIYDRYLRAQGRSAQIDSPRAIGGMAGPGGSNREL